MAATRTFQAFTSRKPRKGQQIVVTGALVSGGTPEADGVACTYGGMLNGLLRLQGVTSDWSFNDPARCAWRSR